MTTPSAKRFNAVLLLELVVSVVGINVFGNALAAPAYVVIALTVLFLPNDGLGRVLNLGSIVLGRPVALTRNERAMIDLSTTTPQMRAAGRLFVFALVCLLVTFVI